MAEYKIVDPSAIHVKGMASTDICGLHALLKQEGCIDSENLFSDREKAIALDGIQERLAQRSHTDKQASADMLICIANGRYVLADAKFRQENVSTGGQTPCATWAAREHSWGQAGHTASGPLHRHYP